VVQQASTTPRMSTAPSSSRPASSKPFKKLSIAEMMERRTLGLCYNCDEQYVRGHKCPKLFYLEVTDFEEDGPSAPCQNTEEEPLISLHTITGHLASPCSGQGQGVHNTN
jgi:hypothetical protein